MHAKRGYALRFALRALEFDNMSTASAHASAPALNLARRQDLFSSHIVLTALKQSVAMLRPDVQIGRAHV